VNRIIITAVYYTGVCEFAVESVRSLQYVITTNKTEIAQAACVCVAKLFAINADVNNNHLIILALSAKRHVMIMSWAVEDIHSEFKA
jgi:hypothetical protein